MLDTRLVVVTRANKAEIVAARHADVCPRPASALSAATGSSATEKPGPNKAAAASGRTERPASSRRHGVLGARFAWTQPETFRWLLAFLGIGIGLLALGALPLSVASERRLVELLARGRGMMALAGLGTIVAVTVAYVLQ